MTAVGGSGRDHSLIYGDRHMIKIEKYEARVENGVIKHYAIDSKGRRYPMPEAFNEMYTDDYLAIKKVRSEMPEVFGIEEPEYFIPLRTAKV